jgi:hypothetical protein
LIHELGMNSGQVGGCAELGYRTSDKPVPRYCCPFQ